MFAYHLGWLYADAARMPAARCRAHGALLALVGFFGLVVTTNLGPYPRAMVATTTDPISNLFPTTAPIAALALFQCGLLLWCRPAIARWLADERRWHRVERIGRRDHHRIELRAEQPLEVRAQRCEPVARADRLAHRGRSIGQRAEIEQLALLPKIEGVLRLAHQPGSHQTDPQSRHERSFPSLERSIKG